MRNKITRRRLLQTSAATGAGLLAAGSGLPAFGQEEELPVGAAGKLTVIHRTEYFEDAQKILRNTLEKFADAHNVNLDASTTNPESFGDFLGKMTAAVKAGNPPDLAYTTNVSIPQMHLLDIVEDVTDVVQEAESRYGRVVPGINAEANGQFDGRWKAIPFIGSTTCFPIRGDKLAEKGIDPATLVNLNDRREAALAISDPDNEFWGWGSTPNQSGDGYGLVEQIMQAHGGSFTDETGQIVTFGSPETVAAYEWIRETFDRNGKYGPMLPPGIESWTDISNNEAWLAGKIGYTLNAFSVYAASKRDKVPFFNDIVLLRAPQALNGDSRDTGIVGGWLTIFKGAPNLDLAKELALELLSPAAFTPMSSVAGGLLMPAYENLWTDELLAADPNYAIIKEMVSIEQPFMGSSWPAQPNAAIGAIRAQGVIEQAAGNVISGRMSPADAVADGHKKIVDIFEEGGIMQP